MWTFREVLRLAHADACADLSDLARGQVSTYGDSAATGGELVGDAERLVAAANEALLLAVAVERQAGTAWERIGEVLGGVSKQAAQKRFGERIDELQLDVLLPRRDAGQAGVPGWWAGPDAARDPDETVRRLDAWAQRHREVTDPGKEHAGELVSHGLREQRHRSLSLIGAVTTLANLLFDATSAFASKALPRGVTERYARRRLLEAKVACYTAMLQERPANPDRAKTAELLTAAHVELVEVCTEEARDVLTVRWTDDEQGRVVLRETPVAALERTVDRHDAEVTGWWLWGLDGDGNPDARDGAWPAAVDVDLDAEREHVEHAAVQAVASHIGSDDAKGIGPFAPGGIAGPGLIER